MEPQLFSCGLPLSKVRLTIPVIASMEPQLFSCGLSRWTILISLNIQSFNGAATFQLRIVDKVRINDIELSKLQWSRNFSVADCRYTSLAASNCPSLQWSRNFSVADWWIRQVSRLSHYFASMEPQLFSCGLYLWGRGIQNFTIRLQWSRNFSVADCF